MQQAQLNQFKSKLEKEEKVVLDELKSLGRVNPTDPKDWETTYSDLHPAIGADEIAAEPDPVDQADLIEEYEARNAIEVPIEERLNQIREALKRIENGTYGMCTASGADHPIETERLEVNPAATTCIKHK